MAAASRDPLVSRARVRARDILRKDMPERWEHTQGVARRAVELSVTVSKDDRPVLVAAAWLHDIGYAPRLKRTGFHPLDGGLFLRKHGWDEELCALVAHHSGARFVPVERGFEQVMATFVFVESPVSDALTYADRTVGPHGVRMTIRHRISETNFRHGPDSPNARARVDRVPYLLAAGDRVEQRLAET